MQEGNGSLSICVVLYSGILERNVQVFLTTTDGTATSAGKIIIGYRIQPKHVMVFHEVGIYYNHVQY